MDNLEEAARNAAARWNDRDKAKDEMRKYAMLLLEKYDDNMTQVAKIIGVSRTSLYYFLYGRDGKTKPAQRAHEPSLSVLERPRNYS